METGGSNTRSDGAFAGSGSDGTFDGAGGGDERDGGGGRVGGGDIERGGRSPRADGGVLASGAPRVGGPTGRLAEAGGGSERGGGPGGDKRERGGGDAGPASSRPAVRGGGGGIARPTSSPAAERADRDCFFLLDGSSTMVPAAGITLACWNMVPLPDLDRRDEARRDHLSEPPTFKRALPRTSNDLRFGTLRATTDLPARVVEVCHRADHPVQDWITRKAWPDACEGPRVGRIVDLARGRKARGRICPFMLALAVLSPRLP
jgi:hypothetical protein